MNYRRFSLPAQPLGTHLLGDTRLRTLVGIGYLVVLTAVVVASTLSTRTTVAGAPIATLSPAFDTLFWALIILVVLSTFVVPIVYALFNGGPVIAFLIAVAPELVVYVTTGTLHLTPDFTLGLVFGAFAAVLAVYVSAYRSYGSLSPGSHADLDDALLFSTAVAVVGTVALARLYVEGPSSMAARTEPYGVVVVPTVAMIAYGWMMRLRAE